MNMECRRKLKYFIREAVVISIGKWRLEPEATVSAGLIFCNAAMLFFFSSSCIFSPKQLCFWWGSLPSPSPPLSLPFPERNDTSPAAAWSCNRQDAHISLCACVTFKNITCQWWETGKEKRVRLEAQVFIAAQPSWGTCGGDQAWKGY